MLQETLGLWPFPTFYKFLHLQRIRFVGKGGVRFVSTVSDLLENRQLWCLYFAHKPEQKLSAIPRVKAGYVFENSFKARKTIKARSALKTWQSKALPRTKILKNFIDFCCCGIILVIILISSLKNLFANKSDILSP